MTDSSTARNSRYPMDNLKRAAPQTMVARN
jgi:hypothetical protein